MPRKYLVIVANFTYIELWFFTRLSTATCGFSAAVLVFLLCLLSSFCYMFFVLILNARYSSFT